MSAEINKSDKSIQEIVIKYVDGTEETVSKGFVGELAEENSQAELTMNFVGMSGEDMQTVLYCMIKLAANTLYGDSSEDEE